MTDINSLRELMGKLEDAVEDLTEVMEHANIYRGLLETNIEALQLSFGDFKQCYNKWKGTLSQEEHAAVTYNEKWMKQWKTRMQDLLHEALTLRDSLSKPTEEELAADIRA